VKLIEEKYQEGHYENLGNSLELEDEDFKAPEVIND